MSPRLEVDELLHERQCVLRATEDAHDTRAILVGDAFSSFERAQHSAGNCALLKSVTSAPSRSRRSHAAQAPVNPAPMITTLIVQRRPLQGWWIRHQASAIPHGEDGMRILLVGALSWNPERIRSLPECGHRALGVWSRSMAWDQGPYPMLDDCVRTITLDEAARTIRR